MSINTFLYNIVGFIFYMKKKHRDKVIFPDSHNTLVSVRKN